MRVLLNGYARLESWLSGWPNAYLTIALILGAGIIVLIALRGSPTTKAVALAYIALP